MTRRRTYRRNDFDDPPEELDAWDVERATGIGERVICHNANPRLQEKGMPTLGDGSHPVEGWRGVFVGDADEWIPFLIRDGFCSGKAWVYQIDFDALAAAGHDYWVMQDPNVFDRGASPDSLLVVTRDRIIPSFAITLTRSIPWRKCKAMHDDVFGGVDEDQFE